MPHLLSLCLSAQVLLIDPRRSEANVHNQFTSGHYVEGGARRLLEGLATRGESGVDGDHLEEDWNVDNVMFQILDWHLGSIEVLQG